MRFEELNNSSNLLSKRVDLQQELGVNDYVWHHSDTIDILNFCKEHNLVILGGDVIKFENQKYFFESSSWYYHGNNSEDSINKAKQFLSSFPADDNTYISFVFLS